MKHINLMVIGGAFLAAFMLQPVAAADFSQLDANQDGYISVDEAEGDASLMESWSTVDMNEDGIVDSEEFSALEITDAPDGEGQDAEDASE